MVLNYLKTIHFNIVKWAAVALDASYSDHNI